MRKLVAGLNMSLDGFCDHTAMGADDELHDHYTELLKNAGTLVYGRVTYQLMESYWPNLVKNPSGSRSDDEFALVIENIPKLVFSRTLKGVTWKNSRLAKGSLQEEIGELKKQPGKDILVGSPSLIAACTNLDLVDEFQICIHPTIVGRGLILFKDITDRKDLQLIKTRTFGCGAVVFYLQPAKEK